MPTKETNVEEFIRLFRAGNERGFSFLFRLHYPTLTMFCFRILRHMEVAEEISQDTLIKLWERREGFDHPMAIRAFLYMAARFACLNHIRDERRKKLRAVMHAYLSEKEEGFVLEQMVSREMYEEALRAVEKLPTKCRCIFESLFMHGQTTDQVARELSVSISTVRNQKARALMLLRKHLETPPRRKEDLVRTENIPDI